MTVDPTIEGLFVRRRFAAPPESVFAAWTDPDLAQRWLFTAQLGEIGEWRIDPRPGGMIQAGGSLHRGFGEVLAVDRPRRLTWPSASQPSGHRWTGSPWTSHRTAIGASSPSRSRGCRRSWRAGQKGTGTRC